MEGGPPLFELNLDAASRRYILGNCITEERCELPAGTWELHSDDDGDWFIADSESDARQWCQYLMEIGCFLHPADGQQWLVTSAVGSFSTLEEYQQRHSVLTVPVQCPGRAEPRELCVVGLHQAVGGSQILWDLAHMYKEFIYNDKQTCGRWYHNWWSWWRKRLSSIGLADVDSHLRKPIATEQYGGLRADPRRMMSHPVSSTYALMVLLVRWGNDSKSHVQKDEHIRTSWTCCLDGILQTCMSNDTCAVLVHADPNTSVHPGKPMQGAKPVFVQCTLGRFDLTTLMECPHHCVSAVFASLPAFRDHKSVSAAHLLRALDRGGNRCTWLFKQFAWHVSNAIDMYVLLKFQENERNAGDPVDGVDDTTGARLLVDEADVLRTHGALA